MDTTIDKTKQEKAHQLLLELKEYIADGTITKAQLQEMLLTDTSANEEKKEKINVQKILYYIGGFILLLGIIFYFQQYWSFLSPISRTIIALGASVSAYSLGYYFYATTKSKDFGHAFLIVSAALFPLGIGTALDVLNISPATSGGVSINAGLLFLIYFVSYYTIKARIFLYVTFIAATTLFFSFTNYIVGDSNSIEHYYEYRTIIVGVSYIAFGLYFSETRRKFMTNLLYFFGLLCILGACLSLQGWKPTINFFWEFIYPFILVSVFRQSIKLQNGIFLLMGTIFTFAEIVKFTYDLFSDSLGWPISLMIAGLLMMGVGYMSFELNRKYVKVIKN